MSKFNWDDFEVESGDRDVPLLISRRSQLLLLSAMRTIQWRHMWFDSEDDPTWDDIDGAISEANHEIMDEKMPDFTPVGCVQWFLGTTVPDKWLKCDGTVYYKTAQPELWDVLVSFRLVEVATGLDQVFTPDMSDRFPYGANNDGEIGVNGGETMHTLTVGELPAHTHKQRRAQSGGAVTDLLSGNTLTTNSASSNIISESTGSGEAHNNMPPYMRGYWIIKAEH